VGTKDRRLFYIPQPEKPPARHGNFCFPVSNIPTTGLSIASGKTCLFLNFKCFKLDSSVSTQGKSAYALHCATSARAETPPEFTFAISPEGFCLSYNASRFLLSFRQRTLPKPGCRSFLTHPIRTDEIRGVCKGDINFPLSSICNHKKLV